MTARLSESELLALWESGTPMDWAWIDSAEFFDRFTLQALKTHPNNDEMLSKYPRYEQIKHWLPNTWEARQRKLEYTRENLRRDLLAELYSGRLWAIGYRTRENGADELVRVPREPFFVDEESEPPVIPDVYWRKGELTVDDKSYFDIRVVTQPGRTNEESEDEVKEPRSGVRKGGRPNTRHEIEETARELLKDEQFRAKRRWDQAIEVRVTILGEEARDQHERSGYKTDTIQRIIGRVARS